MAKVKRPPDHITKLMDALRDGLKQAGISALVDCEAIPTTKLHRVVVLAPKFKPLPHSDRQSLVWRIAENTLPFEEQLLISSIYTLTPEEAGIPKRKGKMRARVAKRS